MTNQEHDRASELIMRQGTEEIAAQDAAWLDLHLSQCPDCAAFAASFEQAGTMLRSFPITASSSLVMSTQARVRVRAEQLREQHARVALMAVSFCVGVLFSTASAWLWWKVGDWVVEQMGLPHSIVAPGVLLFWLLPAISIAVLMVAVPHRLAHPMLVSLAREQEGDVR